MERENKLSDLTCDFEHALRGMGDRGGHAHRRITALLEIPWLTQTLWFLQFTFATEIVTEAGRLLSPLARGLCLETPRVVAAAVELVAGFAILAVPRQSAFHQGALLCISAELQTEEGKGHGAGNCQTWSALSVELTVLCNLCFIYAAFQWERVRDRLIYPELIKENRRGRPRKANKTRGN